MKWFVAKFVYRIICGTGAHTPQFDEQMRLIEAGCREEAFEKAVELGKTEEETFFNDRQQLVCWQFINIPELYQLHAFENGMELSSAIREVDDADAYITFIHHKAAIQSGESCAIHPS